VKWHTHIISSLALAALFGQPLIVAGSVLPDVSERALRLKHRHKAVHNFATGAVFTLLSLVLIPPLAWIGVGFLHHLVLDITRHGVYIVEKRISSPLSTDNPLHNAVVTALHLLMFMLVKS